MARKSTGQVVELERHGGRTFALRFRAYGKRRYLTLLYGAIEKANELLAKEDRPPLPEGITFHALRRTYAALHAELGEHPAITAAQMGHRDPRMTLRVYTDVTGLRPQTRMGGLLGDADWALSGTEGGLAGGQGDETHAPDGPETRQVAGIKRNGSDGTRTRDLRRDRQPITPANRALSKIVGIALGLYSRPTHQTSCLPNPGHHDFQSCAPSGALDLRDTLRTALASGIGLPSRECSPDRPGRRYPRIPVIPGGFGSRPRPAGPK
jgi:hypothetical protein